MTHILEFSVHNLAGRTSPYHQTLNRDLNIFFGNNGSGKTSLMKILHSAIEGDAAILENVPFTKAEVKIFSVSYERAFTRTIAKVEEPETSRPPIEESTFKVFGTLTERETKLKWETSPREPEIKSLAHVYLPISRLYRSSEDTKRFVSGGQVYYSGRTQASSYTEEELDERFAEALRTSWKNYSADISRVVREAQQKGLANILRAVLTEASKRGKKRLVDTSQAYQSVSSFLAREPGFADVLGSKEEFAEKYRRDASLRDVVKDIEEVEKSIEGATAPRERLRELITSMYAGGKDIAFSDNEIDVRLKGGRSIGLPFLSSGEKQILYIFVDTLLAGISTIIIDEPEISMHIDWQKILVKSMRSLNSRAQIILATHSPEIMADVPDGKIFRL
jgi:predicted ATPase